MEMIKKGNKLSKWTFAVAVVLVAGVITLFSGDLAFAKGPGESAGKWVQGEVKGLFMGVVALISLGALVKREFGFLAKFAVIAMVVGLFIWAPQILQSSGSKWFKELLGL
ncbi:MULTISPECIES: hypothetical protein [Bacillota]|uniref:hypothetical protein n=1 Tax=Bacillota TaxID=1239 RepID=UPI0039F0F1C6